ncbi:MAG TPA: HNH endonuclease [Longimicrobiales bacterium]|nr:HNH endonuclease [Longimicrobiales bacterium]
MTTGGAAVRRRRIFARDGHRCVYCGRVLPDEQLSLDHVEPRRKGGDHSDGNLVTACLPCNRLKGGRSAWAFLAAEPEARALFLRHARWVWPRHRRAVLEAAGESGDGTSPEGRDAGCAGPTP